MYVTHCITKCILIKEDLILNELQTRSLFQYFVTSVSVLSSKPGYGAFVPFHKLLMVWE